MYVTPCARARTSVFLVKGVPEKKREEEEEEDAMTRRYFPILRRSPSTPSPIPLRPPSALSPPPPHRPTPTARDINKISSGYTLYRIRTTTSTAGTSRVIQRRVKAPGTWHYIGLTR